MRPASPALPLVTMFLLAVLALDQVIDEELRDPSSTREKVVLLRGWLRYRVLLGLGVAVTAALAPFLPSVSAWLRAQRPPVVAWTTAGVVGLATLLLQPLDPYWHLLVVVAVAAPLLALRHEREHGRLGAIGLCAWLLWWQTHDLRFFKQLWPLGPWPEPGLPEGGAWIARGLSYSASGLLVTAVGLVAFGVVSRQGPERLELHPPRARGVGVGLLALLIVGVLLIPLGVGIGFLKPGWSTMSAGQAALRGLVIALTIALPEEVYFRGVLDGGLRGQLERSRSALLRHPATSLVASSFLFGLMHWNNRDSGGERVAYVLMATIAGAVYGQCYRKGGLWAAVTCHTLVDLCWQALLRAK